MSETSDYMRNHNIACDQSTYDFGRTILYTVDIDKEEALRMRLSIPMLGIMVHPGDHAIHKILQ